MVKTGGEGGKGQTVRSGGGKGPAFEGGQTPWARRLAAAQGCLAEGARHRPLPSDLRRAQRRRPRRLGRDGRSLAAVAAKNTASSSLRDGVKILGGGAKKKSTGTLPAGLKFPRRPVLGVGA
jgi:large subunit ribosomal protein L15